GAGYDQSVRLWDAERGQEWATLGGHTGAVTSVAFRPDGRTLASAGADGTIRLRDAASGQERATLRGHAASVHALAYSPDGKTLASASSYRPWYESVRRPRRRA